MRHVGTTGKISGFAPATNAVIPGCAEGRRPQMRNCASGNLEIPGSMRCIAPE
jgi:hypothetical protein